MRSLIGGLILILAVPLHAQEPVVKWADYTSWGTAATNVTAGLIEGLRSSTPKRTLLRIGLSGATEITTTTLLKHAIESPRPCLGCLPDGMPSGHTAFSDVGAFSSCDPAQAKWGLTLVAVTALLRVLAHRHTWKQVTAGAAVGLGSDLLWRLLLHCEP